MNKRTKIGLALLGCVAAIGLATAALITPVQPEQEQEEPFQTPAEQPEQSQEPLGPSTPFEPPAQPEQPQEEPQQEEPQQEEPFQALPEPEQPQQPPEQGRQYETPAQPQEQPQQQPEQGQHFEGKVEAVDAQAKTLTVNGQEINITDSTKLMKGDQEIAWSDIAAGDDVHGTTRTSLDGKTEALEVNVGAPEGTEAPVPEVPEVPEPR